MRKFIRDLRAKINEDRAFNKKVNELTNLFERYGDFDRIYARESARRIVALTNMHME